MIKSYREWMREKENRFLSAEGKEKREILFKNEDTLKLVKLAKRNYKIDVKTGDVFQIADYDNPNTYFYGKVVYKEIDDNPMFKNGIRLVIILFTCRTTEIGLKEYNPDYNSLICSPFLSTIEVFEKGWAHIIGNIPLTDFEKSFDKVCYGTNDIQFFFQGGYITRASNYLMNSGPKFKEHMALKLKIRELIQPSIFDVDKQNEDYKYNIYKMDIDLKENNVYPIKNQVDSSHFKGKKDDILEGALYNTKKYFYEAFIKITQDKQEVRRGDIFVVTLNKKVYYYGKVVNYYPNMSLDGDEGVAVIEIFQNRHTKPNMDKYKPKHNKLLIEPAVIHEALFKEGFLKIIGNEEINNNDLKNDIGFYGFDIEYRDLKLKKEIESKKRITGISLPYGIFFEILVKTIKKPRLKEPERFFGIPSMEYYEFLDTEETRWLQDRHYKMENDLDLDEDDFEELSDFVDDEELFNKLKEMFDNLYEYIDDEDSMYGKKEINKLKKILDNYTKNILKIDGNELEINKEIERATLEINEFNELFYEKEIIETIERETIVNYICNLAYNHGSNSKDDLTSELRDW